MSTDQDTRTVRGTKYRAIDAVTAGRCLGCDLRNGFGCKMSEEYGHNLCSPDTRDDRRHVIWVPDVDKRR